MSGDMRTVRAVMSQTAPFEETGVLPGNIDAIQNASIYARVDGYLKRRLVDIGDKVKAGQLLAEIDTPTIDEELAQAKADLAEARSNLATANSKLDESTAQLKAAQSQVERAKAEEEFASVTADRWKNMASRGAVSLESKDEKVKNYKAYSATVVTSMAEEKASEAAVATAKSNVETAKAAVVAKQAAVNRYTAQQSFKYVLAPFDGTITLRKVDPGALITSGSQTSSLELFQIAKIDTLRIYINVPQTFASFIKAGLSADVKVPEFPGRIFKGKVTNISDALDPSTRTRQTEVQIDNRDHTLLPGMYAQVKLAVERTEPWIRVPGTALVPLSDGMYVVLARDNKAHYQKVEIGRDFGDEIEIKHGLKINEQVIVSPPVDLQENEPVQTIIESSGKTGMP